MPFSQYEHASVAVSHRPFAGLGSNAELNSGHHTSEIVEAMADRPPWKGTVPPWKRWQGGAHAKAGQTGRPAEAILPVAAPDKADPKPTELPKATPKVSAKATGPPSKPTGVPTRDQAVAEDSPGAR
jgi:hypothetical protein